MLIIRDKKPLMEMASLPVNKAPKELLNRTRRLVIDEWFYDRSERVNDLDKVAFRLSIGIDSSPEPFPDIALDFDYGFVHHSYKYNKGTAKASGVPSDLKWEFKALHVISNLHGAEGQWGRNSFKDKDFEDIILYEHRLTQSSIGAHDIHKLIKDLKLNKISGNILQL